MADPIRFPQIVDGPARGAQGDVGQPEWRAALLAEAIRHTAHLAGPTGFDALFRHLEGWLGLPEEACGHEINVVVLLLVRSGFYTANTFEAWTGDLWLQHNTRLTPSPIVTAYLHGEA